MNTIHRYELIIKDEQRIAMPRGARVLSADVKPGDGVISVWALVDDDEPKESRVFKVVATGQHLGMVELDDFVFVDTVVMRRWDGAVFCWHVFTESL